VRPKFLAEWTKPIARAAFMFDQTRLPQIPQPLSQDAGRHVRYPPCQLSIGQRIRSQLPEHAQRPTLPEHIEQFKHGGFVDRRGSVRPMCYPRHARLPFSRRWTMHYPPAH